MIKFYLLKRVFVVLLLLGSVQAWAQTTQVTGTVTSADDGAPLPGVSILEKGTTNGTVSDSDGKFSINSSRNAILVFSFVGYASQEIPVSATVMNVTLTADVTALSEVVVIGYGEVERKDVTGSVVAISTKDFNRGVMSSPQELLVGKIAGVQVVSGNGAPGSQATIRIRGGSSMTASNDPLFVIDGFPVDNAKISGSPNPLATINPNDIETVTVLKDASAAAIYGSRASNGVIIITTKKGKQDKLAVGYNGNVSVSQPIDYIDVLTGDELRALASELQASGFSGINETSLARLGDANTDWQKEIYRDAISHDHNISISGGVKKLPYRLSVGHTNQQGILKTTELKRNSLSLNVSPSLFNDKLKVDANLKTSISEHNFGDAGAVGAAVAFDPTQPVRNGNTKFGGYFTWTQLSQALPDGSNNPEGDRSTIGVSNPVALLMQTRDLSDVNRTIANLQLDYKLPFLDGLKANINGGFDRAHGEGFKNLEENASFVSNRNEMKKDYFATNTSKLLDFYLNYKKDIQNHGFDFTAGYSWQHFHREGSTYQRTPENTDPRDSTSYKNENFLVSFFGRLNYSLKDRYILTATLRNDGSSRFAEENRWGLFPALALAWNVSEEDFIKSFSAVSNLKLRVGYGVTGQQDITDNQYPYLPVYRESVGGASYQFGNSFYSTLRPNPYDANIKWEETTTYNVGLDFGFANERIRGAVDVYQRETKDLINFIPIPAGSNFSNYLITNVGTLENKGIELSLNGTIIEKENLSWSVGVNVSRNRNEITKLIKTDDPTYPGVAAGDIDGGVGNKIQNQQIGFPYNSFYVYQQVYDSNGDPIEGLYVDRTGDGGTVTSNELNKYHYKNPAPDVLYGINSSVRYRNFDLYLSGRLSLNNYVYNNVMSDRAVYNALYNQAGFWHNVPTAINETKFTQQQLFSDHYLENASFFKMDNISAGYNFQGFFGNGLDNMKGRLSFTVQNAFTITDYSGLDPEVDGGIDKSAYPRPRVFMVGFGLNF